MMVFEGRECALERTIMLPRGAGKEVAGEANEVFEVEASERRQFSEPRDVYDLRELGRQLAESGPMGLQGELEALAWRASAAGVGSVLLAVVTDPRESDVARQRAFARIAAHLERESTTRAGHEFGDVLLDDGCCSDDAWSPV
jgi:hypothetical protein